MDATTVAVDLAKDVFEVAMANRAGRIVERKRLIAAQFERFLDGLPAGTEVVMEACGTAHYWGRACQARPSRDRLLPAQYVRPYVRRNKTDRTDTEALLEAVRCGGCAGAREDGRAADAAGAAPRADAVACRANRPHQCVAGPAPGAGPAGAARRAHRPRTRVAAILEDADGRAARHLRHMLATRPRGSPRARGSDRRARSPARAASRTPSGRRRLQQIPGVGVITATAMVGAVEHIHAFRRGAALCQLVGAHAARITPAAGAGSGRHQQTWRQLFALPADTRGPRGPPDRATTGPGDAEARDAAAAVGRHHRGPARPQQGRDRGREQARRGSSGRSGIVRSISIRRRRTNADRVNGALTQRDAQRGFMIMA